MASQGLCSQHRFSSCMLRPQVSSWLRGALTLWVPTWQVMGVGYTEEVTLTPAPADPAEREPQDAGRHALPNGHARLSSQEEEEVANHRPKRARLSEDDVGGAGHANKQVTLSRGSHAHLQPGGAGLRRPSM